LISFKAMKSIFERKLKCKFKMSDSFLSLKLKLQLDFSGQSATPRGSSEWDSVEALEAKNDSLSSELTDLMEKLKTMEVGVSMKSVERTSR